MISLLLGANQLCDGLYLCPNVDYVAFGFGQNLILFGDVVD